MKEKPLKTNNCNTKKFNSKSQPRVPKKYYSQGCPQINRDYLYIFPFPSYRNASIKKTEIQISWHYKIMNNIYKILRNTGKHSSQAM